jgi:predicted DNA-binding mobile mystery protein A
MVTRSGAKRQNRAPARRALDRRLAPIASLAGTRPAHGWVRAIRDALGMSGADVATRMGVSPSRVAQIERSEAAGELKLSTLERAADSLGCDLVYFLVPRSGSFEADVRARARAKAAEQTRRASHTMRLEDQAVDDTTLDGITDELAAELIDSARLWR